MEMASGWAPWGATFVWGTTLVWVVALVAVMRQVQRLKAACQRRDIHLAALYEALRDRQELAIELVILCDGKLKGEAGLVEAVALSRCHAIQARTVLARVKTETDLCWALARLLIAIERHPELSAREGENPQAPFADLARSMGKIENRAARATMAYNTEVTGLQTVMNSPWIAAVAWLAQVDAGQGFELDPRVAREAMMALMAQRDIDPESWHGPAPSATFAT